MRVAGCHMTLQNPSLSHDLQKMLGTFGLLVFFGALASPCLAAVPGDEVKGLPGWQGALPTRQYSGYIEIDALKQSYLHYW